MSSAIVIQLNMPGMPGGRRTTTPAQYLDGLVTRTAAARKLTGMSQAEMVEALKHRSGFPLSLAAYKKYEIRSPLSQEFIIPFCEITGVDVYMLLTGRPFQLGRRIPEGPFRDEKNAA